MASLSARIVALEDEVAALRRGSSGGSPPSSRWALLKVIMIVGTGWLIAAHLNVVGLTRSGLLLTFLSGFLVAPELIGEERLRHGQLTIDRVLERTNAPLKGKIEEFKTYWVFRSGILVLAVCLGAGLFLLARHRGPGLTLVGISFGATLLFILLYSGDIETLRHRFDPPLFGRALALYLLFYYTRSLLTFLVGTLISYLLRELTGNNRLRALVVSLGIIFYIVGNIFQIKATY